VTGNFLGMLARCWACGLAQAMMGMVFGEWQAMDVAKKMKFKTETATASVGAQPAHVPLKRPPGCDVGGRRRPWRLQWGGWGGSSDWSGVGRLQAAKNIEALYKTFIECDCTMVEVRPRLRPSDWLPGCRRE